MNDFAAAACLITVNLPSWSHFLFRVAPGTTLDFVLVRRHIILVLENGRGGSGALDFSGHCRGWTWPRVPVRLLEWLGGPNPPLLIALSNPTVAGFPTAHLMSLFGLIGAM